MGMSDLVSGRVRLIFTFTGTEKKKSDKASVWHILLVSFICFLLTWVLSVSSHIGIFLFLLHYVMTLFLLWQAVWTVDLCRAQSVIHWREVGSHLITHKARPTLSHCFLKEESFALVCQHEWLQNNVSSYVNSKLKEKTLRGFIPWRQ